MKITVNRKALSEVMAVVTSVVNPRHTNPTIQNALFDADENGLVIRATDLEVSFQCAVSGTSVTTPGKALLPAVRLAGLLKDMPVETVEMSLEGDTMMLSAERDRITLQTSDAEGFPSFPTFEDKNALTLKAEDLEKGLSWTGKSIAPERGRYAFNGVLATPGENGVELCGTDGRRLSYWRVPSTSLKVSFPVIIPRRGIELLTRMASKNPASDVAIDVRENEIVARMDDALISSQLVDGQFPDYWSYIPRQNDKTFVARRDDLISGLKLAGHVTSVESQAVALLMSTNELTLNTRSPGMGSAEVKVSITYDGPDSKVGFDPRYLLDGLSLMAKDDVVCDFRDGDTGAIFHEGDKDQAFFLIMPLDVG